MDLTHITSQSLRRLLNLSERKDQLVKLVAELETEISKVLSAPVAKTREKKTAPARKAGKRASSRKAKSGALKARILSLLENAGTGGLKVKEIAEKLGASAGNISVWISTTGKNLVSKVEPGVYAVKGAKPAAASTRAKTASARAQKAVKPSSKKAFRLLKIKGKN